MHGNGHRTHCHECGQPVDHLDRLAHLRWVELRGPRNITSSDLDRIFDDRGQRFLVVEEKRPNEVVPPGQKRMLYALADTPGFTVFGVVGTPEALTVWELRPNGTRRWITDGTVAEYQAAVMDWFQ